MYHNPQKLLAENLCPLVAAGNSKNRAEDFFLELNLRQPVGIQIFHDNAPLIIKMNIMVEMIFRQRFRLQIWIRITEIQFGYFDHMAAMGNIVSF